MTQKRTKISYLKNKLSRNTTQHNTTQHNTTQHNTTTKNVVLMNDWAFDEPKVCRLKVGTWSESQQKKFIKSLYDHVSPKGIGCLCNFNVEYDNTRLCDIGLDAGVGCTIDDWPTELKDANKGEFAIIMKPFIDRDIGIKDDRLYCKCGVKQPHQCPNYIKNGKCTAPSMQKLVGSVLFPDKYPQGR